MSGFLIFMGVVFTSLLLLILAVIAVGLFLRWTGDVL